MAKQTGIIRIEGKLAGLSFYTRLGKPVVRVPGGFTKKAIKSKKSMQRVRENNSEFGMCARNKKFFLLALRQMFGDFSHSDLHSRLMQLFIQIKNLDVQSPRGERNVYRALQEADNKEKLKGFQINPKVNIPEMICSAYNIENINRLTIKEVSVMKFLRKEGSSVGLTFGQLEFNYKTNSYIFSVSEELLLTKRDEGANVIINCDHESQSGGYRIGILGMKVYTEINSKIYRLEGETNYGIGIL